MAENTSSMDCKTVIAIGEDGEELLEGSKGNVPARTPFHQNWHDVGALIHISTHTASDNNEEDPPPPMEGLSLATEDSGSEEDQGQLGQENEVRENSLPPDELGTDLFSACPPQNDLMLSLPILYTPLQVETESNVQLTTQMSDNRIITSKKNRASLRNTKSDPEITHNSSAHVDERESNGNSSDNWTTEEENDKSEGDDIPGNQADDDEEQSGGSEKEIMLKGIKKRKQQIKNATTTDDDTDSSSLPYMPTDLYDRALLLKTKRMQNDGRGKNNESGDFHSAHARLTRRQITGLTDQERIAWSRFSQSLDSFDEHNAGHCCILGAFKVTGSWFFGLLRRTAGAVLRCFAILPNSVDPKYPEQKARKLKRTKEEENIRKLRRPNKRNRRRRSSFRSWQESFERNIDERNLKVGTTRRARQFNLYE